jgi:Ser/Thr protein kinase RdoA (MazF antagonist)
VHEVPDGVDIYRDAHSWTPFRSIQHAFSAGEALARMHVAARGHDAPRRGIRPLVASFTVFAAENPRDALNEYVAARPALKQSRQTNKACAAALELLAPFHAELQPLLPALAPLWTHGDLHASNLLWSDAGEEAQATAIIDFGLADRTNAVHDLALAIERNVVEWLALGADSGSADVVPVHHDALDALLCGYESVRAMSREEAAALAPMTALCHAEFALSEADYFLGVLHSEEKAKLAFDYLVDHARWFRDDGARLLDTIRNRTRYGCVGGA